MEWENASVSETGLVVEVYRHIWKIRNLDVILKAWFENQDTSLLDRQEIRLRAGATIGYPSIWKVFFKTDAYPNNYVEGLFLTAELDDNSFEGAAEKLYAKLEIEWNGENFDLPPPPFSCLKNTLELQSCFVKYDMNEDYYMQVLEDLEKQGETWNLKLKLTLATNLPESNLEIVKQTQKDHLMQDLGKWLKYTDAPGLGTDVEFRIKNKGSLYAHRTVLIARSRVFERMYAADMKEAKTGIVEIQDVSMAGMKLVLQYIYTGTLEISVAQQELLSEMAYAADKYELVGMQDWLNQIIMEVCTFANAKKLWEVAIKHNLEKSKEYLRILFPAQVQV